MLHRLLMSGWGGLALAMLLAGCSATGSSGPSTSQKARVQYTLGVAELRSNNPTLALAKFLEAEKFDRRDPNIQEGLAQAYHRKEAYAEAEKHYLRAIDLNPEEPRYYNNLGTLYLDMQRPDDALTYLEKAAGNLLFSQPEVPLTGIGIAHFQKRDYLGAVAAYREALSKNPHYAEAYLRLGEALAALNRPDRALEEYHKALAMTPDSGRLHFLMGLAYMKTGDIDQARQAFAKVRELLPESAMGMRAGDYLEMLQ